MPNDIFNKEKTLPDLVSSHEEITPCPRKIGPYKIDSLFNKGGMSFLYLGVHPVTNKTLIVKVLSPKYLRNKEVVERFLKEAEIIQMTNHPNIVKLYGQGTWEHGLYIAMEFIQGISLRQFILQRSLSHKRALEIILQVSYALCHLHSHGVIHRDVKPENILITETGEIKVIDFGISQLNSDVKSAGATTKKKLIGTPTYMSPEQKDNPSKVSYASDIYSLGIITYELVLGRLSHGVIQLSLLPSDMQQLIGKALKSNPKDRYQDIVDFITDISHYLEKTRYEKVSDEDKSDEVITSLHKTQHLLFSKTTPKWPQVDIGLAYNNGLSLTGLYIDFFTLPDNHLGVILAEPIKEGITSLIPTSVLRGMVRMAITQTYTYNNKTIKPASFLTSLNQTLTKDSLHENFAISFLLLNKETNQLTYSSCSHNAIWHVADSTEQIQSLTTPNQLLGEDANTTIVETIGNWNFGDKLLLFSFGAVSPNYDEKKQAEIKRIIDNNIMYSAKGLAKKVLEEISPLSGNKKTNRLAVVITLQRIFG
jgi:eukaryotic-like serine/threonine-protein kinase